MRLSARFVLLWWALMRPQISLARRGETSLVPKYYDIRSCEDKPHRMNISNVTIVMGDDGEERINAVFQLGEAIRAVNLVVITLNRCTGGISPNQCEHWGRFNFRGGNTCSLIMSKGRLWSPIMASVVPPMTKCPMKAGTYAIRNGSIDCSRMNILAVGIPLEKHIWIGETQLWNERENLVVCFKGAMEWRRVKKRN